MALSTEEFGESFSGTGVASLDSFEGVTYFSITTVGFSDTSSGF